MLGLLIGASTAVFRCGRRNISKYDMVCCACFIGIGAVVGAKLLSIITSIEIIIEYNLSFIQIMQNGFVFYGGFIGGILGLIIYCKIYGLSLIDFMDTVAVSVPLGHALGRVGCFFSGCCYGIRFSGFPSVIYTQAIDVNVPLNTPLLPVQLIEACFLILLYIVCALVFYKVKTKGICRLVYAGSYAIGRFILEFFRGDYARGFILGISTSQFISICILIILIAYVIICSLPIDIFIFKLIDIVFYKSKDKNCKANDISVTQNIKYSDDENCRLDVYRNNSTAIQPALIYIHGGGFVACGKTYRKSVCEWYASQNLTVFCLDYGQNKNTSLQSCTHNIVKAFNFIVENSRQFNIDREKICVSADSSGAFYSTLLVALYDNEEIIQKFGFKINKKVHAVIYNCGVFEIKQLMEKDAIFNINNKIYKRVMNKTYNREDIDFLSAENILIKDYPKCFLVYSKKDLLCKGQTETFIKLLEKNKIEYEEYHSKGFFQNHCFSLIFKSKQAKTANEKISFFLKNKVLEK